MEISEEEYYSCGSFSSRIWPIYAFIGWLVFVLIFTESLNAKYRAEGEEYTMNYEGRFEKFILKE